jgi:glycosyltransferase involved in cell wall biosynthesis
LKLKKLISIKDNKVKFLIPSNADIKPSKIKLSIVIPAYNEKKTIKKFIEWCKLGILNINLEKNSEIIIIDSSNDGTDKIALEAGAKVVKTPLRGLGRAYLDGMEFVSGKYMILGDADCTYDFRNLSNFYKKFENGYEFIMGSRMKGYIEKGSMPKLHRYFGIPITNFLLNFIYNSKFSDIHCGMRGITKEAFLKMQLNSQKWGYASEMLIKAIRLQLKTAQVPINFYVALNNRQSVHVREGILSPWIAGIQNLNQMLTYGSDFIFKKIFYFLFFPSLIFFFYTMLISEIFMGIQFQFHWSFSFFTILILSYLSLFFSDIVKITYQIGLKNFNLELINKKIRYGILDYALFLAAMLFVLPTIVEYLNKFSLNINFSRTNFFLFGLSLFVLSIIKFFEYFFYKGLKKIYNL